jgi:hypothetical protein
MTTGPLLGAVEVCSVVIFSPEPTHLPFVSHPVCLGLEAAFALHQHGYLQLKTAVNLRVISFFAHSIGCLTLFPFRSDNWSDNQPAARSCLRLQVQPIELLV